jgi:hypothetical protein
VIIVLLFAFLVCAAIFFLYLMLLFVLVLLVVFALALRGIFALPIRIVILGQEKLVTFSVMGAVLGPCSLQQQVRGPVGWFARLLLGVLARTFIIRGVAGFEVPTLGSDSKFPLLVACFNVSFVSMCSQISTN